MILTAGLVPGMSGAQVPTPPTRPGLDLGNSSLPQGSGRVGGATSGNRETGRGIPSSDLVQREVQGQRRAPSPDQNRRQAPPEEFFYVKEGSDGPDALASGLSDFNSDRMREAGNQLRGQYGDVQTLGSLPAGVVQDAWKRPFDNMSAGQASPGSIRYQWSSDLIMPVRLRSGMVSSIILPEWEAAEDVIIGDGSAVEATIVRPNQIGVKSVQTGLDTSLSVVGGSGNVYTFYVRTEGRNTSLITDLQVFVQASPSRGSDRWFNGEVRGAYVRGESSSLSDERMPEESSDSIVVPGSASQGDAPVPTSRREFNLKMYEVNDGDRMIAPEFAYTDGKFTYLHFPPGVTDRPAVFRIVDGVEGRVNTRTAGRQGEVVIVEALGDLVLRSGTRAVCVITVDKDGKPSYRRN